MRRPATLLARLLVAGALFAPLATAQSRFDLREVAWTMAPDPGGDWIGMTMQLAPLHDRARTLLRIPLWRPGSYRYAAYQDNVSELRAVDQDGNERAIQALDPRTWEVDSAGADALTVTYRLAVENDADDGATPAIHLHSPMAFLYVEDALQLPHSLRLDLPRGWDFASGHRADADDPEVRWSPNYDVFVDCPIALGELERHEFESHGKPFEVVLFGKMPTEAQFSRSAWLDKVQRISEAAHDVVGDYPFERYVYLFLFSDIGGGYGLEHLNSTTIAFNHRAIKAGQISGLESVTAHEFFHLWNVKRIRPQQLGPFDYATDVRTRDLWWLEGVTSYYNDVILQRAGLRPQQDWFWNSQAQNFRNVMAQPGYGVLSPERSSWTVWEPNPRTRISYYDSGQSLGLLLDLKIRSETGNRRSLDDVVRFLHRWVAYPGEGYRPGDLERAIRAVTGWDCAAFFDRHVAGLVDMPWEEVGPQAGLDVVYRRAGEPVLGFSLVEGLELEVAESSTAHEAGLRSGDRLRSVGGRTVANSDELLEVLRDLGEAAEVEVEVRRGSTRRKIDVPVRRRTRPIFRLTPAADAGPAEAAIRAGVLDGTPRGV